MEPRDFALLLIGFLLLLFPRPAGATTYYVDAIHGDDANNGTSLSTPWQTIAKVNSVKLNPGDFVLFKRGVIWREQLDVVNSGTVGHPITFGAYGNGSLPTISAADLATAWAMDASAKYLWTEGGVGPTNQVFEDGARLAAAQAPGTMTAGTFYYNVAARTLYVRMLTDDNPNSHIIEVSQRNYAIYEAGGNSYITLEGLQTSAADGTDIYFNGSTSITISDVTATNAFGEGIRFDVIANSLIDSTIASWNGSNGISADDVPNLVIHGCLAHHNASLANVNYTAGIKINPDYAPYPGSSNVTIENSESYANGSSQSASGEWLGAGIWADTIDGGLMIQRNLVQGNNLLGIYLDAVSNGTVAYNISYGNGQAGAIDGGGIAVYGDNRTIAEDSVYGNTVYGNLTGGIKVRGSSLPEGCNRTVVKNNIVVGSISGPNLEASGGCENSGSDGTDNAYEYNAFGPATSNFIDYGGDFLSTYSALDTAYGGNTHSVAGDPLFTNAAADDFTLRPNSPAIAAGQNLGSSSQYGLAPGSSWTANVLTANQKSGAWDIGAYVSK